MLLIFQFPLVVGRQQIKENNTSFFPIARCISMESESRHRSLGRCEPVKIKEMVSNVIGDVIPNINTVPLEMLVLLVLSPMNHPTISPRSSDAGEEHLEREVRVWGP